MSIHIGAEPGQVAPTVLMPGDPLRAKYFAETFLEGAALFNAVRGMLGYTGTYRGKRVSVMGSGMGIPSLAIYVTELITEYNVKTLIRVGTCGGMQASLKVGDLVLAMSASTDSSMNRLTFGGSDFAPTASFGLLMKAYEAARRREARVTVGSVYTSDIFYSDNPDWWRIWAQHGILAAEMETAGLYTLAAKHGVEALSIMTVSDNPVTGEFASSEQREKGFPLMAEIALEIAPEE